MRRCDGSHVVEVFGAECYGLGWQGLVSWNRCVPRGKKVQQVLEGHSCGKKARKESTSGQARLQPLIDTWLQQNRPA